ncbi:DUF4259 domain-containing protein [Georgenia faecalis]|uniref:DUF4259 domain-containing protein n=1 Tax=Georgenia faecalis TaxID=2483799 RepID=A0ABV9D8D3_9MICO|nr:DUF4259 domain-containing protein [Georgenia faecalis]
MGTWGTGPFDNDNAADWAGDVADADAAARPAMIRDALAAVAHAEGYVNSEEAEIALAAGALVAAAQSNGPQLGSYGPSATALEGVVLDDGVRALAVLAVTRVLGASSEWRELWEEAGELGAAREALVPLLSRLGAPADGVS